MPRFEEVTRVAPAALEEEILAYWDRHDIFAESVRQRDPAKTYSFFEGPPTANGRPGIHHVLARTIKDVFCRYHTMKGYRVERKAGWDTHGLPVEIEVEKALGLDGREDILAYGMEKFNAACQQSVLEYKEEWDQLTRLMGYWVDLEKPYITFETNYIESVWWLLKQIFDKGLLYQGHKIQWYSPGSGTVLSSHEVSLGYKEVQDPSVYVMFRGQTDPDTYFLAWTTTPWTLVSNAALAVGPDITYVKVRVAAHPDELLILAEARLEVLKDEYEVVETLAGRDLVGTRYEPVFGHFAAQGHDAWRVVPASFVSTSDGTGIVHIAPAFGVDDNATGQKEGLPVFNPVDMEGCFEADVPLVGGQWFKKADKALVRDLRDRGLLYRHETYLHNYPHDWRKGTPLISYPVKSWFIRTTAIRDRLVELNKTIGWQPEAIGLGRFGEWLENNVDWALSRRRFWGTPLPVWVSDKDGAYAEAIGSIEELRTKCGDQLPADDEELNLHRPYVDALTWPAPDGGTMRRVPETIDVWFDSGAMPFAQWHYPFENKEAFERSFPADFISEGIDQTRGWFYTLHAIAALVMDDVAFKNCVVGGLVLDEKGEKMSKTKGNAVDPFEVIRTWGADRVRWYMMSNSPPWEDLKFAEKGIREVDSKLFSTLTNVYSFFAIYANIDGFTGKQVIVPLADRPELDRWILSRLQTTASEVDAAYAGYHPTRAARAIERFVDELSNWYIRRSRRRFWSAKGTRTDTDKWAAYQTVYTCLESVARMMAPLAPFFADWLYQRVGGVGLGGPQSVHLASFPKSNEVAVDHALEHRMGLAKTASSLVLGLRSQASIPTRQPLSRLLLVTGPDALREDLERVAPVILSEVNVKRIEYLTGKSSLVRLRARPNFRQLGRRFGKLVPKLKAAIASLDQESLQAYEESGSLQVTVDGEEVTLGADDMQITTEGIEGWLVSSEGGVTVALDTVLTQELVHEGYARESINRLQNLRKRTGYEVSDRIDVEFKASSELAAALAHHERWIRNEVLALAFKRVDEPNGEAVEAFAFSGEELTLGIRKCSPTSSGAEPPN